MRDLFLRKPIDELALAIHNDNSDIVMVFETWLSNEISESITSARHPRFSVIRNDREKKR